MEVVFVLIGLVLVFAILWQRARAQGLSDQLSQANEKLARTEEKFQEAQDKERASDVDEANHIVDRRDAADFLRGSFPGARKSKVPGSN